MCRRVSCSLAGIFSESPYHGSSNPVRRPPAIPSNAIMDHKLRESIGKVLDRHPDIRLCMAFGSIASGKASAGSDLDIAVAAGHSLPSQEYLALIEELSTATHREVDLVDLMTATGPISKQALSTGVIVRNRDKGLYAKLISRMLFNQADMMPYYDRILRERRRRLLNG